MRVSKTALASAFLLAFSASCATPLPTNRRDNARSERRAPEPARYEYAPSHSRAPAREASDQDGPGNYTPPVRGRFSLLFGERSIDESAFMPTDSPGVFAIEYSQVPDPGGLGFEFGLGLGFEDEDGALLPDSTIADLELRQ
ncbi:MAG: hypothetical protein VX460_04655, partial [Planctomycetota bacterium]|nr:hypothetical protein [Planctomycetota bacterium]